MLKLAVKRLSFIDDQELLLSKAVLLKNTLKNLRGNKNICYNNVGPLETEQAAEIGAVSSGPEILSLPVQHTRSQDPPAIKTQILVS